MDNTQPEWTAAWNHSPANETIVWIKCQRLQHLICIYQALQLRHGMVSVDMNITVIVFNPPARLRFACYSTEEWSPDIHFSGPTAGVAVCACHSEPLDNLAAAWLNRTSDNLQQRG
jgi:hypothetical protein